MANQQQEVIKKVLQEKKIRDLLKIMKVLCGSMRFKILMTLKYLGENGLTGSELAVILGASPSRISHQLKILKDAKLISVKKRNREVWYILADHRLGKYLFNIGI